MKPTDVQVALDELKAGIDGSAVALFDHHTNQIHTSTERPPDAFWKAFNGVPCLPIEWTTWYGELRAVGRHATTCGCGDRHQLYGLVINERVAIVIVARGLFVRDGIVEPGIAPSYSQGMSQLLLSIMESQLEINVRRRGSRRQSGGGGAGPAELAIPLWWHERSQG